MGFAAKFASVAVAGTVVVAGSGTALYFTRPSLVVEGYRRYLRYNIGLKTRCMTTSEGFKFCYVERGQPCTTSPSVVLVHGYAGSLDDWTSTVQHFSAETHVIALDLPCHGNTGCQPHTDLNIHGLTEKLHEFLSAAELSKVHDIHLVGQSLGGAVAGCYTAAHPEKVRLLTMVCPVVKTPTKSEYTEVGEAALLEKEPYCCMTDSSIEGFKETLNYCLNFDVEIPKQILKGITDMRRPYFKHWETLFMSMAEDVMLAEDDKHLGASARNIDVPTQLVWGDRDRVVHCSGAQVLQDRLPDCRRVHMLPGLGHSISLICPRQLAGFIIDFQMAHSVDNVDNVDKAKGTA